MGRWANRVGRVEYRGPGGEGILQRLKPYICRRIERHKARVLGYLEAKTLAAWERGVVCSTMKHNGSSGI